jgi:nitric oxide reductase activation protein
MLMALTAAGMTAGNSFSVVHGSPGYPDCTSVVGKAPLRVNLFQIMEYIRIFRVIRRRWPGAEKLLNHGFETEFSRPASPTEADRVLRRLLHQAPKEEDLLIRRLARESRDFNETASMVNEYGSKLSDENPGLDYDLLSPLSFCPDLMFPAEPGSAFPAGVSLDTQKHRAEAGENKSGAGEKVSAQLAEGESEPSEETQSDEHEERCYTYDEWSAAQNAYRKDYCSLYEMRPREAEEHEPEPGLVKESERVRKFFERIKPELMRREKRLPQGDYINIDLLIEYLTLKRSQSSPEIRFYEKPFVETRDLAVNLLLDVSGSTGEDSHDARAIDTEKKSAFALAEGLDSLGDRFAISGFSSNGKDRCEYYLYKDFADTWGPSAMHRLLGARPVNSTRIGPALRHAGRRLSDLPNRRKLILLITDGKPMDQDYDPKTGYAQADVRKACEENRLMGVETYAVCTREDSAADMEFMFPAHRFVLIEGVARLPSALPRLYMSLTS